MYMYVCMDMYTTHTSLQTLRSMQTYASKYKRPSLQITEEYSSTIQEICSRYCNEPRGTEREKSSTGAKAMDSPNHGSGVCVHEWCVNERQSKCGGGRVVKYVWVCGNLGHSVNAWWWIWPEQSFPDRASYRTHFRSLSTRRRIPGASLLLAGASLILGC